MGRFDWAGRPRGHNEPRRFAAVIQLLSIEHNRRLRLRVFCEDDSLPLVPSLTLVWPGVNWRSEEHTSELQSLMRISYAVFCLKKKNTTKDTNTSTTHKKHIKHTTR